MYINNRKVVVATDNSLFFMPNYSNNIEYIYLKTNELLNYLNNNNVDVIIIHPLKGTKLCKLIANLEKKNLLKKIIVIMDLSNPCPYISYLYFKIHCILSSSTTENEIIYSIEEILNKERHNKNIYNEISKELKSFGISPKYNGYQYLKDSIYITILDKKKKMKLSKNIYPLVSQVHHTKAATVESSIRRAKECCWKRAQSIEELFIYCLDNEKGIATNKEFIETIADIITSNIEINLY